MPLPTIQQVIDVLRAERGYRETPDNITKYWAELDAALGKITVSSGKQIWRQGNEWCAGGASWGYWVASGHEMTHPLPNNGFYCPADVNRWRTLGRIISDPEPGALCYFYGANGQAYHVETVIEVNGKTSFSTMGFNTKPAYVVDPGGGMVAQMGPYRGERGDGPSRVRLKNMVFAMPEYAAVQTPGTSRPPVIVPPTPIGDIDVEHKIIRFPGPRDPDTGLAVPGRENWIGVGAMYYAPMTRMPTGILRALYVMWLPTQEAVNAELSYGCTYHDMGNPADLVRTPLEGPVPSGDARWDWSAASFLPKG